MKRLPLITTLFLFVFIPSALLAQDFNRVKDLKVTEFLKTTYHVFKRNGKYKLKVTYWYGMTTDYQGPLTPQKKEGIKKAKWKNLVKSRKALENSYENIKLVFPEHYLV